MKNVINLFVPIIIQPILSNHFACLRTINPIKARKALNNIQEGYW